MLNPAFNQTNNRPLVQLGLTGVSYYAVEDPFINILRQSNNWGISNDATPRPIEYKDLTFNQHHVPIVPRGFTGRMHTAPLFSNAQDPETFKQFMGKWIIDWEGDGDIDLDLINDKRSIKKSKNALTFELRAPTTLWLVLRKSSPSMRNIRMYRESDKLAMAAGEIFRKPFLDSVSRFDCLRYMDWLETNNSTAVDVKDMKPESEPFWGAHSRDIPNRTTGVPISICLKLSAKTRTIPWLTLPHRASRDLVDHFAEQVRQHCPKDIPVMFEYSNEVWNWGFKQTGYAVARGKQFAPHLNYNMRYFYGWHSAKILWRLRELCPEHTIVGALGTKTASITRVLLNGQDWKGRAGVTGQSILGAQAYLREKKTNIEVKHLFDVAITTYFEGRRDGKFAGYTDEELIAKVQSDPRGLMREMHEEFMHGPQKNSVSTLKGLKNNFAVQVETAEAYGMDTICYEGGSHVVINHIVRENAAVLAWYKEYLRSEYMAEQVAASLEAAAEAGVKMLSDFGHVGEVSKWGPWGTIDHYGDMDNPINLVWEEWLN